jgi:hypothetical protein
MLAILAAYRAAPTATHSSIQAAIFLVFSAILCFCLNSQAIYFCGIDQPTH